MTRVDNKERSATKGRSSPIALVEAIDLSMAR